MLLITGCLAGSEMFVCCQRDLRWKAIALPLPPTQPLPSPPSLRQPPAPICVTAWSSRTKTMPQGAWTRAPAKPDRLRGGFTLCLIEQSYSCIKPCNIFVCKPQLWIAQVEVAWLFRLAGGRRGNKRRSVWTGWDRQAADCWRLGANLMCSTPCFDSEQSNVLSCCEGLRVNSFKRDVQPVLTDHTGGNVETSGEFHDI